MCMDVFTSSPSRTVVVTAALSALLLTACGGGGDAEDGTALPTPSPASPSPTSSPGTSPDPARTSSPAPADDDGGLDSPVLRPGANTQKATGSGTASSVALVTDVRLGAHAGFDRVVIEFAGDGTPEYEVEYVDSPIRAAGSGDVVPVRGDAFLRILMHGASGVDLSGETFEETYPGPDRLPGGRLDVVEELVRSGDFEATLSWVAGVRTPEPFTVRALTDPARLVVDIRTP